MEFLYFCIQFNIKTSTCTYQVGACAVYGQITGGYRGTKISASKPCLYSLIFTWVALVVILSVPHGSLLVPLQKNKKDYMRILESYRSGYNMTVRKANFTKHLL